MRLTPVRRAVGAVLARDIPAPDPSQMPVLRAGAVLTEAYQGALAGLGINAIWVEDELSEGIEPVELVAPQLREEAARSVAGALAEARDGLARGHGLAGADLLDSPKFSPLVRAVVREHHERWDGRGYPRRLSGTQINELARICAVADVYDAVTSERPYKPACPPARGLAAVLGGAGTAF